MESTEDHELYNDIVCERSVSLSTSSVNEDQASEDKDYGVYDESITTDEFYQ